MEEKNLIAEMAEKMDEKERFFFGLLAILALKPELAENFEKELEKLKLLE